MQLRLTRNSQEREATACACERPPARKGDALQTLRRVAGPIDLLFLDGWKELCLPVLKLLEDRLAPGAAIFCDDTDGFRKTLKPYTDYVRAPAGAFISTALPLGDGLEFSVRV